MMFVRLIFLAHLTDSVSPLPSKSHDSAGFKLHTFYIYISASWTSGCAKKNDSRIFGLGTRWEVSPRSHLLAPGRNPLGP
jgi:hypothetical protein